MIRKDCSGKMGKLLMTGWTMLAESCPTCQVPLMRSPTTPHQFVCVNCDTNTSKVDQVAPAYQETCTFPSTSQQQHLSSCQEEGQEEEDSMEEETPISDTITRHEEARGGPRSSAAALAAAAVASLPTLPRVPTPAESAAASKAKSDECADMLSTKMLQGWALLASGCPVCSTTLVRNKQRRVFCVSCDQWVLTQAEADEMDRQQQQLAATRDAEAAATAAAAASTPDPSASTPSPLHTAIPAQPTAAAAAAVAAAPHASAATAVQATPATSAATPSASTAAAAVALPASVMACLVSTVTEKMRQALLQLHETPVSDVEKCRALLALVGDCLALLSQPAVAALVPRST